MKLAIIVPVFNVEQYLQKCIESIQNQRYNHIEIILVDDGSTDSSGEICDRLALADPRISVYHKSNGGLMSAWKFGLNNTTAEYIGFVDSDDWIDEDMYSEMINKAIIERADIVTSGLVQEFGDGRNPVKSEFVLPEGLYDEEDIENTIFPVLISGGDYHTRGLQPHRVTKIYRKDILQKCLDYCSDEVSIGEDLLTTFCALKYVNRIYIMSSFYPYHYRINSDSMINKYSVQKYEQISILRKHMMEVNEEHKYDFTIQINTDYIKLWLMQMEREILYSNDSTKSIADHIKRLYESNEVVLALRQAEAGKLPIKYRFYLLLIRFNLFRTMVLLRRIKK